MKSNLTTEAGPSNNPSDEHINAINQVFALFQLNYHNQYFKAFSNNKDLTHIKRLWFEALKGFSPNIIMLAAREVVKETEYLPTLKKMLDACQAVSQPNLASAHQAFIEACQAPSPKANFKWSHPIVYHAGAASDWFFLQSNSEYITFPIFKKHYEHMLQQLKKGETFHAPKRLNIADNTHTPLDKKQNKQHLDALRKSLGDF